MRVHTECKPLERGQRGRFVHVKRWREQESHVPVRVVRDAPNSKTVEICGDALILDQCRARERCGPARTASGDRHPHSVTVPCITQPPCAERVRPDAPYGAPCPICSPQDASELEPPAPQKRSVTVRPFHTIVGLAYPARSSVAVVMSGPVRRGQQRQLLPGWG